MKTVKDKYLVVGADFAGYPLKEAVCAHLREKGWKITDLGVTADSDPDKDTDLMFHRVGLRVGAEIAEGNFEPIRNAAWAEWIGEPHLILNKNGKTRSTFSGFCLFTGTTSGEYSVQRAHLSLLTISYFNVLTN